MSDFKDLKRNSQKNFKELTSRFNKSQTYGSDEFWKPKLDKKDPKYFAVIRFLPASPGEQVPYVEQFSHYFQDPKTGMWYIELSRTTLGKDVKDPVSESNRKLWESGSESNKNIARARKRKHEYISNILVISDPKNPDAEGKVFKYKFGPKIFEKIKNTMQPPEEFADEEPIDVFNFWTGADFKLKASVVSGQWSYDQSAFARPAPLFDGDDEAIESIWNKQYKLLEEIAPGKFKSYDELKARFDLVTGAQAERDEQEAFEEVVAKPEKVNKSYTPTRQSMDISDDSDLDEFANLLNDD